MTCIANYPTKKAFKEHVALEPAAVLIEDPSTVRPRSFTVSQMRPGESIVVTNHPKRSWFAEVKRMDTANPAKQFVVK